MPGYSRNIDSFDFRELFRIPPIARAILRGHIKIAVIQIVLINSHEDSFRYISGHAVLDGDTIKIEQKCTRFFLLSPSASSVIQVCTEKITVHHRINLL